MKVGQWACLFATKKNFTIHVSLSLFQFEQFQFFQLKQPTLVIRTCNFEFSLSVLLVFLVFSVSHYYFLDVLL